MSGSAAIAGARRRRASSDNSSISNNLVNQEQQSQKVQPPSKSYSIVQVIQLHESRIKRLEDKLLNNTDNISTQPMVDNVNKTPTLDREEVDKIVKDCVKAESGDRFNDIYSKISTIEANLNSLSSTINQEKLLSEISDLKTLVIKSQLQSIETSNKLLSIESKIEKENSINSELNTTNNLSILEKLLNCEYDINSPLEDCDLDKKEINISSVISDTEYNVDIIDLEEQQQKQSEEECDKEEDEKIECEVHQQHDKE